MNRRDLFNQDSICIFTDASFKSTDPNPNTNIGSVCSGACVYLNNLLIDQTYHILHNTTTQRGELYAIYLGVTMAYKYRNFKNIRIFSDSQTSIFAIRDRIFKWIYEYNHGKHVLGYDGNIKNQDYIMDIIYEIISNNLSIEFYHVKGHVDIRSYDSLRNATEVFVKSNYIYENLDVDLIQQIAIGNDQVDRYTGCMLYYYMDSPRFNTTGMIPAVTTSYFEFDVNKYRTLINYDSKATGGY